MPRSEPVVGRARTASAGLALQISFRGVPHKRRLSDFIRCAWTSLRRGRGHRIVFEVGEGRSLLLAGWFSSEHDQPNQRRPVLASQWMRQLQHRNPGQSLVWFSPRHRWAHAPSHNLHRATTARTLQHRTHLHRHLHRTRGKLEHQVQQRNQPTARRHAVRPYRQPLTQS